MPIEPTTPLPNSPCIRVCTLDEANVCIGCGRNVDEITRWTLMTADEQFEVLAVSQQRRARRESLIQEVMKRGTEQRR
jgi:predicted Fe-S protein YdhL (DUF1289 family)